MNSHPVSISRVSWQDHGRLLSSVRREVFVVEQGVSEEEEIDEHDAVAWHFLARDSAGTPIGTSRLLPSGRIGRVAVLSSWRGKGVGRALVLEVLRASRELGLPRAHLHAQVWTIPFYERLGFAVCGEEFDEAGIAHRAMELVETASKNPLTPP